MTPTEFISKHKINLAYLLIGLIITGIAIYIFGINIGMLQFTTNSSELCISVNGTC